MLEPRRHTANRRVTEQGYAGKLRHNEVLERLVTAEKDLQTEKSRLVEAEAGLAAPDEIKRSNHDQDHDADLQDWRCLREC